MFVKYEKKDFLCKHWNCGYWEVLCKCAELLVFLALSGNTGFSVVTLVLNDPTCSQWQHLFSVANTCSQWLPLFSVTALVLSESSDGTCFQWQRLFDLNNMWIVIMNDCPHLWSGSALQHCCICYLTLKYESVMLMFSILYYEAVSVAVLICIL